MAEGNKHTGGDAVIVKAALKSGRTAVMSVRREAPDAEKMNQEKIQATSAKPECGQRETSKETVQDGGRGGESYIHLLPGPNRNYN